MRIPLLVNGTNVAVYYVDFEVTRADGAVDLVEVKGAETDVWKLKRNMLLAGYLADHPAIGLPLLLAKHDPVARTVLLVLLKCPGGPLQ